jgi:YaiO family outer membrane protein
MPTTMIRRYLLLFFALCCCSLFGSGVGAANPLFCSADDERPDYKNRIEAGISGDFLNPASTYGTWGGLNLGFYRKERPDLTWFVQTSGLARSKEGNGVLGTIGAYKDWTEWLFTYSAFSTSSNTSYTPALRFDHDFNIKFGPDRKFVWTIGGSYIKYHDVHKTAIVSTGLTAYHGYWVGEYRLFYNISDPGSIGSFSHLVSLGYGREGCHWTHVTVRFGKQAYQATSLATPENVNKTSYDVTLSHRHWLGKDWGLFGSLGWFELKDGYKKIGTSAGYFKEF